LKGEKTGGRSSGTPNKEGREVKTFLGRVFGRAFSESRADVSPTTGQPIEGAPLRSLEDRLVDGIITLSLDTKLIVRLLDGYAGKPAQAHDVRGRITLEDLVSGNVPEDDVDDVDETGSSSESGA
jgi:hypothetical protein